MLLDFAADKVIKKYESANCDELKAMKGQPPSEKEKMAIDFLRDDPQRARKAFIGRRGGPARHGSAASLPGDPARQVSPTPRCN
jgi:hypothetical protein